MNTPGDLFDTLQLSTLRNHWQVVLMTTAMCGVIFTLSSVFSPLFFPKAFSLFQGYNRPSWHIHVVSTLHSIIAVVGSFFIMADSHLATDRVFGYSGWAANIYSISCGYFIWDVIMAICFFEHQGISMVFHGVSSFLVFIMAFYPFVNYYGAIFLMYEVSTIFLNFNWFMGKLGWTGSKVYMYNGIALVASYFLARIVFGFVMSYYMWVDVYAVKDLVPLRYWVVYGLANFVTSCLNLFWFRLLVMKVKKHFSKKSPIKQQ